MKKIFLIMIGLSVGLMADFVRDTSTTTVTDNSTELQWQDNATPAAMQWQSAIDYCEGLTLGGKSDWRLPNLNELLSLVDDTTFNPSISSVFVNTFPNYYWSSTSNADITNDHVWVVYFNDGREYDNQPKTNNNFVRCVRAGQ